MWQNKLHILLQKIVIFLIGIFLIIFSIFTFFSLLGFNPEDPSFNSSSTSGEVKNWMGISGSHISDLLFQTIGFSAFFLCFMIFKIGVKISSRGSKKNIVMKFILLPIFILSLSTFFAIFPEPDWWIFSTPGGVNGFFIINKIFLPEIVAAFLGLVIAIFTMLAIIEVKISDISYFIRFSVLLIRHGFNLLIESIFKNKISINRIDKKDLANEKDIDPEEKIVENIESKIEEVEKPESQTKKVNKTRQSLQNLSKGDSLYGLPRTDLLNELEENNVKKVSKKQLEEQGKLLVKTLSDFGVHGQAISAKLGPVITCLLYTSPSPRDRTRSRMPSSA